MLVSFPVYGFSYLRLVSIHTIMATPSRRPPPTRVTTQPHSFGEQVIHTTWIFQVCVAVYFILVLGASTLSEVVLRYRIELYEFIFYFSNRLVVLLIIFVAVIQWSALDIRTERLSIFVLEGIKSLLATGMWIWLLLDAMFAHAWPHEPDE